MSPWADISSDDIPEHPIEWTPGDEDEPGDITDEIQLEKFIQVLQMAQVLAQDKEKGDGTKRQKVYNKNAPRTKRRWRKARKEYQAAGGKLITNWFKRKDANPPVCSRFFALKNEGDADAPQMNEIEGVHGEIDPPGVGAEAEGIEMCLGEEDLPDHISGIQVTRLSCSTMYVLTSVLVVRA